MSKVIEEKKRYDGIKSIVQTNDGKGYCVDTANTWDHGPETMVFKYSLRKKTVTNWTDLYVNWYDDMTSAYASHEYIVHNLEDFLP